MNPVVVAIISFIHLIHEHLVVLQRKLEAITCANSGMQLAMLADM